MSPTTEPPSPAGPSAPDPARRNEASRRAILAAALELIGEVGYERTTIEAIAARAGVGKQTIYRWWGSKGAVLLDAFTEPRADLPDTGTTEATEVPWSSGDFGPDLERMVADTVAEFATPAFEAPYRAIVVAIQGDPVLGDELRRRVMQPGFDQVAAWIGQARAAGQVAADVSTDVAIEAIFGPIFHRWLLGTGPLDAEYAKRLTVMVRRALLADEGT